MQLRAQLSEDEIKAAIAAWVADKQKVAVTPGDVSLTITRGEHDRMTFTPDSVRAEVAYKTKD